MVPDLEQVAQAILEGRLVQRISDTPAERDTPIGRYIQLTRH